MDEKKKLRQFNLASLVFGFVILLGLVIGHGLRYEWIPGAIIIAMLAITGPLAWIFECRSSADESYAQSRRGTQRGAAIFFLVVIFAVLYVISLIFWT